MVAVSSIAVGFVLMLSLMFLGIHIASAMFFTALLGGALYLGMPIVKQLGVVTWGVQNDFVLVAIPFYILLGEILLRSGVTERLYASLSDWLKWLPGGIAHSNIAACSLFSAVSGSSFAAAATIATVALPTFENRGYDERLVLGTITAGGTLGILIPPSIAMILYGSLTETSIGALFIAGIVPGLLLALFFAATVVVACLINPTLAQDTTKNVKPPLRDRLYRLGHLIPIAVIIFIVLGSIYFGWATPTESAALGVIAALGIAAWYRKLTFHMLYESCAAALKTTGMLLLIIVGAFYLNVMISIIGIPQALASYVTTLELSPTMMILFIVLFYLLLGCVMESISMMMATIPIMAPIVVALGFDPVWFGIVVVVAVEAALITPPIGMNLYIVQSVRGHGEIGDVIVGTLPFLLPMVVLIAAIIAFPELVLWLPRSMLN